MWRALIEEIARRAEEMSGEKEMACYVRGYHVYKDIIYGHQQFGKHGTNQRQKNFHCRIIFMQNSFRNLHFLRMKIFLQRK